MVAFAGYPLLVSGKVVGVVAMFSRHALEETVLEELSFSAETTALFVARKFAEEEQGRLFDAAMAARSEVELLNEIGKTIAAELDGNKLTEAVTSAATRLTRAEFGVFAPARNLSGPVRSDDIAADPRYAKVGPDHGMPPAHRAVRSYLAVPVISRTGDVLGGLFFCHSQPGVFGERDERMVAGLAAQASVAMDNAQIFDQLERKVEERTARLRETIAELQAFSYTVSHDLRAPLRAMQSYAEALKEDFGEKMDQGAMTYLTRIELAGYRLDRLIQDVLTYSRISQGTLQLRPVSLGKLVREIIEQYPNLSAAQEAIRLEGELPRVMAEESPATQCISNLLGNALKFIPKDRTPSVRIHAEQCGDFVRLWISDNGIGIAAADMERIFKMFERVGGDVEYEGTGIGLAIVRKAMERMGGAAGVESKLGEGSNFWLDFRKQ
jgi:signal transduction histidine kinase